MKRFLPCLMLLLCISGLSYYRWHSDRSSADSTAFDSVLAAPRYFASAAEAPALSECLLTPDGSRLRVLVVRQDAIVEQDDNPAVGPAVTLPPLTPLFVFSCHPNAIDARRYRVGTTPYRESVLGWIAAQDVVPWRNHEGLRIKPRIRDQVTKVPVFASPISGPRQHATATPIAWLLEKSGQQGVAAARPAWPVLQQVTVPAGPDPIVWYQVLLPTRQFQPAFAAPEQRCLTDGLNVPLDMVFLFENSTTTRPYRFACLTAAREMIATGSIEWVVQPPTSGAVVAGWVPGRLEGVTLTERCSFLGPEGQRALCAEVASLRGYMLDSSGDAAVADPHCFFARPRTTTLTSHFCERGLPPLAACWDRSQSQLAEIAFADRQRLLHELEVVVDLVSEPSSVSAAGAWIPTEAAQ